MGTRFLMKDDLDDLMFSVCTFNAVQYELKASTGDWEIEGGFQEIIGGCYATQFQDWVELAVVSVNPKYRRKGIGTYLVKKVIADHPQSIICLMVDTSYIPEAPLSYDALVEWYQKLGFVVGSPYHLGAGWMSRTPQKM